MIGLRNMKIKQLLKQSWEICIKQWKLIAFIIFVAYLPLNLFLEFSPMAQIDISDMQAFIKITQISGFYELLIGSFAGILIILMTKQVMEGKKTSFTELWSSKFNIPTYGRFVWTTLIKNLLIGLLMLLLFIPGLLFAIYWLFAEQIAVLDNEGGINALTKSQAMVKGKWFSFFAFALAGFLVPIIGGLIIVNGQLFLVDHWAFNLLTSFIADLFQAFFIVYLTVGYLKIRKTA
ncbi:hypothetical protein KKG46_01635 [Patescibacteria group bacterium]|nr:hypothetical protein [Patescibacteria group bacterium]